LIQIQYLFNIFSAHNSTFTRPFSRGGFVPGAQRSGRNHSG
jgi:hypothetical protein